jgi:hypothetical protein
MKRLFEISLEEKQRILEMHESATKKNYLSEQTAQQKVPVPGQDILTQIGKSFNITDVLSKWKTQNQGFSGNYYWVSKHNDDASGAISSASVLSLYAFQPYGTLYQFFSLNYSNQTKKWAIQKYDLGNPSPQNLAADVLKNVVIFNPTELYGVRRIPIENRTYDTFVKTYVTNNPDSSISRSFKTSKEKLVATKDTTQAQVDTIKKSPLYLALNTSASTPTSPTTPTAR